MKVALVNAHRDFSNVGAIFSMCLEKVGIEAISCHAKGHKFQEYTPSSKLCSVAHMLEVIKNFDVVVWMQSTHFGSKTNKKEVVFHGGSQYRLYVSKMNKLWNPIVDVSLIQTAEMLGKGAKNEKWMLPAAYVGDYSTPKFSVSKKLIIGHYPSIATKKKGVDLYIEGSDIINTTIKDFDVEYRYSTKKVPWKENLKRMSECDVYIESLSQGSSTTNKHDWSVTALEAASLGCIVVSNFGFGESRYLREYGEHALQVANTGAQLRGVLEYLTGLSESMLIQLKKNSVQWAREKHGLIPIGNRLREYIEI